MTVISRTQLGHKTRVTCAVCTEMW